LDLSRFWDPFPSLKQRLTGVAGVIEATWEGCPAPFRKDLEPLLLTPGKMLRPAFLLMAASSAKEEDHPLICRTAAAVEILHTASLIHDDILDNAPARRGIPTLHRKVGIKRAVLEGDYLLSRALQLASDASDPFLLDGLNRAMENLCASEIDQDFGRGGLFIGRERYLTRVRGKTAELFGLSLMAGAKLGGQNRENIRHAYEAGIEFGVSFQIGDDILDYRGSRRKLGKPTGKDLREGIPTLPLIMAREKGDAMTNALCRKPLNVLFSRTLYRRIERLGCLEEAEREGRTYLERSRILMGRLDFPDSLLFGQVMEILAARQF
jgi:heptaprenyl diphosphate synthase